jgi:hypothetical protein
MAKNTFSVILIILILLLGGGVWYFYNKVQGLEVALKSEAQNVNALRDSLRVSTTKNGDLVYSKSVLMGEKDKLEKWNSKLMDRIEELGGDVTQLSQTILSLEMELDSTDNDELVKVSDSIYGIKWEFDKHYADGNLRILKGTTSFMVTHNPTFVITPLKTKITRDYINISLLHGLRYQGGYLESFSTSKFPGLSVLKQETAVITSNKKTSLLDIFKNNTSFGGYIGYGGTYVVNEAKFYMGPQIGGGLNFTF